MTFWLIILAVIILGLLALPWVYFFSYMQAYGWHQGFKYGLNEDYKKQKQEK
jgi:hypothetical protein